MEESTNTPIREIEIDRLIFEISTRPYDAYVEALRRKTFILESKSMWIPKRVAMSERKLDTLTKVVRAYYALRANQAAATSPAIGATQ